MRHLDERGGVTAEFAVVLPAILLILGVVIGAAMLSASRVAHVSAAYDLARLEARGDHNLAAERRKDLPPGATTATVIDGNLLCITVTSNPGRGILNVITLTATGCTIRTLDAT